MSKYVMGMLAGCLCIGACADSGAGTQDPAGTEDPRAEEQAIEESTQALSRCGPVPRRPWPAGCHFSCVCSGPVNGPYGEDPADYECSGFPDVLIDGRPGGECHLSSRGDCAFELVCDDDVYAP